MHLYAPRRRRVLAHRSRCGCGGVSPARCQDAHAIRSAAKRYGCHAHARPTSRRLERARPETAGEHVTGLWPSRVREYVRRCAVGVPPVRASGRAGAIGSAARVVLLRLRAVTCPGASWSALCTCLTPRRRDNASRVRAERCIVDAVLYRSDAPDRGGVHAIHRALCVRRRAVRGHFLLLRSLRVLRVSAGVRRAGLARACAIAVRTQEDSADE